ncbi:hypothetical protein [Holdemania massiliensis]|nr:hypothetical protein [Holdemania massiliensis]MSA88120.1 hypothetical protein [Holdemania massiliensis]
MKKTTQLGFAGILPLVVGKGLSLVITLLPITGWMLLPVNAVLFFLWFRLAYRLFDEHKNLFIQSFLMCAFGLLMLLLLLFQEFVAGHWRLNILSTSCQLYFLPGLSLMSFVLSPFLFGAKEAVRFWPLFLCEWIILFILCLIGGFMKRRDRF